LKRKNGLDLMQTVSLGADGIAASALLITNTAAGSVDIIGNIMIGLVSGVICFIGVYWLKSKLKYDDSLDAFGVHGLNGLWGVIATGIFANPSVNSAGKGLLYDNPAQVIVQFEQF
jgi:Amt family ammonium transporter